MLDGDGDGVVCETGSRQARRVQKYKRTQDQLAGTFRNKRVYAFFSMVCLLFIHSRAPNLISLRSAGTMAWT